jgi:hypothetical protein
MWRPSELELWSNDISTFEKDEKIEQLEKKVQELMLIIDILNNSNNMLQKHGNRLYHILYAQKTNNTDKIIDSEYFNIENAIKKWEETANIKRVNE